METKRPLDVKHIDDIFGEEYIIIISNITYNTSVHFTAIDSRFDFNTDCDKFDLE